jgi:hypothetical protein
MRTASPRPRRPRALPAFLALGLSVLAALLWARLKLVTGLPRSAYAEPAPPADAAPRARGGVSNAER